MALTDAKCAQIILDDYEHTCRLSRSRWAWEFLRRNIEYKRSYDEFLQRSEKSEEVTREFTSRWGLRFRSRSLVFGNNIAHLLGREPRSFDCGSGKKSRSPRFDFR